MPRGRGPIKDHYKAKRDADETQRFFSQDKRDAPDTNTLSSLGEQNEGLPPSIFQVLTSSLEKCQDELLSRESKPDTVNPHVLFFDEQIFAMFPRSKRWLREEAKATGRSPCDVLFAMVRARLDQGDHFRLIKALCMQDDADKNLIESLRRDICKHSLQRVEDEVNKTPIQSLLRDYFNDLCPTLESERVTDFTSTIKNLNEFRGKTSRRGLSESDAALLKGISVMASIEDRALSFQSLPGSFEDQAEERTKLHRANGKEPASKKNKGNQLQPAAGEGSQMTTVLQAIDTAMAGVDIKAPSKTEKLAPTRANVQEMPDRFCWLGVPVPSTLPENFRQDVWAFGQTCHDIDVKTEEVATTYAKLDCALHIWTSSMDHIRWERTKSSPSQLWRLPIVEEYLKVRTELLANVEVAFMTDKRLMRQLNGDLRSMIGPDLFPNIKASGTPEAIDKRWSFFRREAAKYPDMGGVMARLEKYRNDVCHLYDTFHAVTSMIRRSKKAGEPSTASVKENKRTPEAEKSPVFRFTANRQRAPGWQTSRSQSQSGNIVERKRRREPIAIQRSASESKLPEIGLN